MGKIRSRLRLTALFVITAVSVLVFSTGQGYALAGAHSYTDGAHGDVFLGGDYIELGVSSYGSFGTSGSASSLPPGFYGTAAHNNIGMSSNGAGFGVAPDTRIDYFLPGTPEERWVVGYKVGGTQYKGNNSLLMNAHDIADNSVTNQSSGNKLQATSTGTFNSKLKITQAISFNGGDKYFKNVVTLKNVDSAPLDSVRYMRTFDPDNTSDLDGNSATHNVVLMSRAGGDNKEVVVADTSNNNSDPVYLVNGSRSPILFFTTDARAKVSTFGFSNSDPYAVAAYDTPAAKGAAVNADKAITVTADVGTLAAGASTDFVYYTSLDNSDVNDVIDSISQAASADIDNVDDATEDAGPNNGDGNGDGTRDSQQPNVTSLPNTIVGGGAYQTLETTGCDTISSIYVKPASNYGTDGSYNYPLGMTDFAINCANPGDATTIKIFYDKQYDTTGWTARKFSNGSFMAIPGASFGTAIVGGKTVTTLTYSVKDGGPLDADGSANGTIVDPAGPAVLPGAPVTATAPNTGLPAQSFLYTILPLVAGAIIISYAARRQQKTS